MIFEYKGMSFSTHPSDMLYVYRLKGYDPDWQPATREMRVYYRDLSPGDYTFQVRAVDRDLNYSEMAQAAAFGRGGSAHHRPDRRTQQC